MMIRVIFAAGTRSTLLTATVGPNQEVFYEWGDDVFIVIDMV